jgi:Heparinase II/III-like protein
VFFLKGEYWVIRDRVRSDDKHHLAIHWHWAPGVSVCAEKDTLEARIADGVESRVEARIFARAGQLSCEDGWVSKAYGTRTRAPVSVFRIDSEQTEEVVTVFASSTAAVRLKDCVWRSASRREPGVLTIVKGTTLDTILTGPTNAERECDGIISDATWTWVRRSLSGELLAFALIQGRNLIVDNRREFRAESVVDCAVGQQGSKRIEELCAVSAE